MVLRNPFITVIVTGVPGVGKTTVLGRVAEKLRSKGVRFEIVNFGDYMFREASAAGLVRHRDEMRHLPLRRQLELQESAARAIIADASSKLGGDGVLLVDTHAVIRTSTGFWPGLPENVVRELKPDSIVLIEAPPEIIVARQQRDKSRVRSDVASVETVRELLEMARKAAMASAVLVAASVYPVENVEGNPDIAAEKIVELIEKLR
ncbi:adenylate kinase [Hyperthermus butylicus]|uniref:Adenylate kinase n=1 Tax=Hyperthermus butylicus (strain DSM 5456 / JCM 9403 / PLM1-5) TaxID=415426 RepID=A2BME3_HYPBU|nr:adenylate kinase [Hyperthermus butylicus]ABM81154.1 Adenylate kinase [Hyperthermus butylicus DSM 5456]